MSIHNSLSRDKIALVSGGGRGLGHEMVLVLAPRRADVAIASRKLDNCNALVEGSGL
jgi:NAD(P)-dependent dehydrogenase (short-subunit alcohol dehydrogenase family)